MQGRGQQLVRCRAARLPGLYTNAAHCSSSAQCCASSGKDPARAHSSSCGLRRVSAPVCDAAFERASNSTGCVHMCCGITWQRVGLQHTAALPPVLTSGRPHSHSPAVPTSRCPSAGCSLAGRALSPPAARLPCTARQGPWQPRQAASPAAAAPAAGIAVGSRPVPWPRWFACLGSCMAWRRDETLNGEGATPAMRSMAVDAQRVAKLLHNPSASLLPIVPH